VLTYLLLNFFLKRAGELRIIKLREEMSPKWTKVQCLKRQNTRPPNSCCAQYSSLLLRMKTVGHKRRQTAKVPAGTTHTLALHYSPRRSLDLIMAAPRPKPSRCLAPTRSQRSNSSKKTLLVPLMEGLTPSKVALFR
jgi:hypothetical protein